MIATAESRGTRRRAACAVVSLLIGLTQGLGLNLVSTNLAGIQGSIGATAAEAAWLTTGYFAMALSATLLTTKFRLHAGLRTFAVLGLALVLAVNALHLATDALATAVAVRVALGFAAAPLSTLAVLYMIEACPLKAAAAGLVLGFATLQLGMPIARMLSPELLEIGRWHGLYLFEVALSALSLAGILAVPLTPTPTRAAFSRGDWISFPLYAASFVFLSIAVSQGRLHWWRDTAWIGVCLAAAIGLMALFLIFELLRGRPMVNLQWLLRPYMLRFVAAVLLFRIVLSEQTVGIVGLMNLMGQGNEQMRLLFGIVALATVLGFALSLVIAAKGGASYLALVATVLIGCAAWMDASVTSLTRPHELLLSQALLTLGLSSFFAAACLMGFGPVVKEGGENLVSFVAAFSAANYLGVLVGSAWISTFIADRQAFHFVALAQHLTGADPEIVRRIAQGAAGVARQVVDPYARGLQGVSALAVAVTREAAVRAYIDLFQTLAALSGAMAVWLGYVRWRYWWATRPPKPSPTPTAPA